MKEGLSKRLPGGRDPQLRRAPNDGQDGLTIRAEGDIPDIWKRVTDDAARFCIPQPGRSILTSGQDSPAVGAEGYRRHGAPMYERRIEKLRGDGVPQPCRAVLAAGQDSLAIGAEGHSPNSEGMREGLAKKLTACGVPQPSESAGGAG
jgi:hypothetical protein